VFDLSHFETRWKTLFASGDPNFSPRLTQNSDDYRPDDEPVQAVFAGHHPLRCCGRDRMGTDRQASRCFAAEHDLQSMLFLATGRLPAKFRLHAWLESTIVQEVSEIFLDRPVERHTVLPLVELEPVVVAAPMPKAQPKGRGRRKAMPTPREEAAPNAAPKVEKSAVTKAKSIRERRGQRSVAGRRALPSSHEAVMTDAWTMMH
jgi:hypothetical protein